MRRILALILCLSVLPLPVRAADAKYAALTFDDGPSGKYTRQLLDGLYDRGIHATFLLCGYRIKDYPDVAQRIFDEGHEIGLHGYSHDTMKTMSRRAIAAEIADTQALLPQGCVPKFLRPPGGFCTDGVRQVAEARQLAILSWSVDPKDWAVKNAAAVERMVLKNVKDGDIIEAGAMRFEVLETPGHTTGGVCYLERKEKVLLSGDTIFAGAIGRTDHPGGDYDTIMKSIFGKLMSLDRDITVIPGHGPASDIATERMTNPFLLPFNEPYEE